MATETTTASTVSTDRPPSDLEFHPIDWWADAAVAPKLEHQRRIPPIPAFVRLSRLVDPATVSAARGVVPVVPTEAGTEMPEGGEPPEPLDTESTPVSNSGWADSAGRPLFRIGLAAVVAAILVAVLTFAQQNDGLTTIESPDATVIQPGFDETARPVGGPTTSPDEAVGDPADDQTHDVLEALVRQIAADTDADVSVVGTASRSGTDIRWTAMVRNAGPGTAEGPITVVQTIGSDFELVSIAGNGWECDHLQTTRTITCEFDGDLATGQRRRLGLVTSTGGVVPGTPIPSTMSAVAGTNDPDLDNNTITVTAVSAAADSDDDTRSSSAGAAGESGSDTEAEAAATDTAATSGSADSDQTGTAGMDELPHTGSGLVVALGATGVVLCLVGRRLMTWSSRAQTRTMLVAANIE